MTPDTTSRAQTHCLRPCARLFRHEQQFGPVWFAPRRDVRTMAVYLCGVATCAGQEEEGQTSAICLSLDGHGSARTGEASVCEVREAREEREGSKLASERRDMRRFGRRCCQLSGHSACGQLEKRIQACTARG